MYPLKSQFCTHLSDSIRIDMYSFVKALFIARPTDAKQSRQSPDIKVSVWKASEERERERGVFAPVSHPNDAALHMEISSLQHTCGAVELLCFHWWTGIQIKEQSMSDRPDLQLCINIWLLTSPQHIGRIKIACSGFVLKVLNLMLLFVDCRPQKVKVMVLFYFNFQWGLQSL